MPCFHNSIGENKMSAISELLAAPPEDFIRKLFPAGEYLCQIVEAEIKHGYWKPNPSKNRAARWMETYVPTIEIVDVVPSGDEDIDAALVTALDNFGDWKGFRPPSGSGRWVQMQTVPGYEDKIQCAGIANGLNYILADSTPEWAGLKEIAPSATRFYTSQNSQGNIDGFVHKILSTDVEAHEPPVSTVEPLLKVVEATKGCFLLVTLRIEEDPTGEYDPKVVCDGVAPV